MTHQKDQKDNGEQARLGERDLDISLLLEDVREAKLVAAQLRPLGIYAHYYNCLADFWSDCERKGTDLLIIDVKKLSDGRTLFKDHELVKNQQLDFALYYGESTKVLLSSNRSLAALELINRDLNPEQQLASLVEGLRKTKRLNQEKEVLESRLATLLRNEKNLRAQADMAADLKREREDFDDIAKRLCASVSYESYLSHVINVFSQWELCEEFSLYVLDPKAQKLVSPQIIKKKYHSLPALWLPEESKQGISKDAQEMAYEVARDVHGESMRSLALFSSRKYPEMMIFGQFSERISQSFPWQALAERLSFYLTRSLSQGGEPESFSEQGHKKQTQLSCAQALEFLDEMHFELKHQDYKVYTVSLSSMLKVICQTGSQRFSWKSFETQFLDELERLLGERSFYSTLSPSTMLLFIPARESADVVSKLNVFVAKFPYWRFFHDPSLILGDSFEAHITYASKNSFQFLRKEIEVATRETAGVRRENPSVARDLAQ